jgi:hypothetical protein
MVPRQGLKKVPRKLVMTSREAAEHLSGVGIPGKWPIGDVPHARLALIYALSPAHAAVRSQILSNVQHAWPEYDWEAFWNEHRVEEKGVGPWGMYVNAWTMAHAGEPDYPRAANNGRARNNRGWWPWDEAATAPEAKTFFVDYEIWTHEGYPRRGGQHFTGPELSAWYIATTRDPRVMGIRIKGVSGGSMSQVAEIIGIPASALNNSAKQGKARTARLLSIPETLKKTPQSQASWVTFKGMPIGDLFWAVQALKKTRGRADVFSAVVEIHPYYDWAGFLIHKHQVKAANNPVLKLGKSYYDELPTNAGPYLPQMFPYGQVGRPATYGRE